MSTTKEKIAAISNELNKQVLLAEDSFKTINHTLSLMKNDAGTYNQALEFLGSVSIISHFLLQLKNIINSGDDKKAESFIRFNCYQIEQFTAKDALEAEEPTGSHVLDAKIVSYNIFKSFVEILDAE